MKLKSTPIYLEVNNYSVVIDGYHPTVRRLVFEIDKPKDEDGMRSFRDVLTHEIYKGDGSSIC